MPTYSFRETLLDTVIGPTKAVAVRHDDTAADTADTTDTDVGRVVRGELPGCEKHGTFRFEPTGGEPTSLGVRRATTRTVARRLLRPVYLVEHGGRQWTFTDRIGENLLYFAVTGDLDGVRVDARADWDGSVQLTADSTEIGRLRPDETHGRMRVEVVADGPAADPGSALFGLTVLTAFLYRFYQQETELISWLFE